MARIAVNRAALRPDLRLAARDPWALRLAALVAVVAALVFVRDSRRSNRFPPRSP
ncbi:MAG: hypothetical protein H6896_12955 [Rhodovulum sp.]|nr:hypothetical protein [Rhodovulum sp.]